MNDKKIIDKMNKDENYRKAVLIDLNCTLQLAERITYTPSGKVSPQEYKLAVVSLEEENQQLKDKFKKAIEMIEKMTEKELNDITYKGEHYLVCGSDFGEGADIILDILKGDNITNHNKIKSSEEIIDEAIKYINEELDECGGYVSGSDLDYDYIKPLLEILKGDKE